jgi:hypothetical protein
MHVDTITVLSYMSRTSELMNLLTAWKPRILYTCRGFELRRNFGSSETGLKTSESERKV